ncbi:hypothetical protein D3C71_1558890 [compost metagenome]
MTPKGSMAANVSPSMTAADRMTLPMFRITFKHHRVQPPIVSDANSSMYSALLKRCNHIGDQPICASNKSIRVMGHAQSHHNQMLGRHDHNKLPHMAQGEKRVTRHMEHPPGGNIRSIPVP